MLTTDDYEDTFLATAAEFYGYSDFIENVHHALLKDYKIEFINDTDLFSFKMKMYYQYLIVLNKIESIRSIIYYELLE